MDTNYDDIRETPAGEPDGPVVSHDRTAEERAADMDAALRAPESPAVAPTDERKTFRVRLEANGDPDQWEQGVIYAPSLEEAKKVPALAGMVRDGWHVVWVKPVPADEASGLA
jgi:hypothetical protein